MKILIAYDGSPSAEAALGEVVRRPWPAGSEVRLVTVIERPPDLTSPGGIGLYAPLMERVRTTMREEAYRLVHRALSRLAARPEIEADYELRDGNAKQALLEAIGDWQPDLVIAGSHGTSGLARFFLGSVSQTLVTHAPCSVEIVRAGAAA